MPYIVDNTNKTVHSVNTNTEERVNSRYQTTDLHSVFTHYDPKLGKNVETENKLPIKE